MKLCFGCDSDLCRERGCRGTATAADVLDWSGFDPRRHARPPDDFPDRPGNPDDRDRHRRRAGRDRG